MEHDPVERVLSVLKAHGKIVKPERHDFVAQCPAHDDARPSLHISRGRSGDCLLHCRAGCPIPAVLAALQLPWLALKAGEQAESETNTMRVQSVSSRALQRSGFDSANAAAKFMAGKRGKWSHCWKYTNAAGDPIGIVLRWNHADGGQDICPVWRIAGRWHLRWPADERPLYLLDELGSSGRAFVAEGEKCADILHGIGVCATTSSGGSQSAAKSCWQPLAGRDVCVLPDADDAGAGYAQGVKAQLDALRPSPRVRIVRLPSLRVGSGDDVEQWLEHRHHGDADAAFAELQRLADAAFAQKGGA